MSLSVETQQGPRIRERLKRAPQRTLLGRWLRSFSRSTRSGDSRQVIALCHALLSERGEVSGSRLASEVLAAYHSLDAEALDSFFNGLVREFSPNAANVAATAEAFQSEPSQMNLIRLQGAVEPPRQELFRRLNLAPRAVGVLVEMRRRLLSTLSSHPERLVIDADLVHLFRSWFNRGFLVLQSIDWRTSAMVLERLIDHEAVHQIHGWKDLRRRLEVDRRCYAFFHPALPDDPLIFIEVALTRGIPTQVQPLLNPDSAPADPAKANCAVFYSITNCQEGLRGISFGNFLIKQVAEDLSQAFPALRTFTTLSPVPGFVDWLASEGASAACQQSQELRLLVQSVRGGDTNRAVDARLRKEVSALCAYYLVNAKRGRVPLDSVARFHLANGARLERLNWMGDTSPVGIRRSLGLTVNYVYRLSDVEKNHEAYAQEYRVVASREFQRLSNFALSRMSLTRVGRNGS